jgi:hypothetical protein
MNTSILSENGDKKKYIYENIGKINNHNNFLDIIKFHDCPFTKNSNGIFLNLNSLNDDVINEFYYKLKNELEDNTINETINEKKIIEEEINNLLEVKNKEIKKDIYTIIDLSLFSESDQDIIKLSKKYKI